MGNSHGNGLDEDDNAIIAVFLAQEVLIFEKFLVDDDVNSVEDNIGRFSRGRCTRNLFGVDLELASRHSAKQHAPGTQRKR